MNDWGIIAALCGTLTILAVTIFILSRRLVDTNILLAQQCRESGTMLMLFCDETRESALELAKAERDKPDPVGVSPSNPLPVIDPNAVAVPIDSTTNAYSG